MKIKIRLHSGERIEAEALPTSHPLLFVTPMRIKKEFSETGRERWAEDDWAITHKPTGYAIAYTSNRKAAVKLAQLFAISAIPWKKLRTKKDVQRYAKEVAILEKFNADQQQAEIFG